MSGRLHGKRALVTGSTSNIGWAIAEAFSAEGAHVIVSGRSAERGGEVVDGIRARSGRTDFVRADLDGSAEASHALAREAMSGLGGGVEHLAKQPPVYPPSRTPYS